ncbi:RES domain-containing protein [Demequina sp. SYSU T00068]|uniref:HEPN-associated N-terminal domain-containing protein n=1 Tax=Demequina lignilytica TaxID=3051663 RepID=UPI00263729E6|nr:HEPN-associated N-terminal domain-containing protein [Demequina sp. SYSU T00068]MDN4489257.1 RES domain-containing protein [Demequina sp. SYSU T00068]
MDDSPGSWSSSDKNVCWRCVHNDDYLIDKLRSAGIDSEECSYCGRTGAAPLDTLLELVEIAVASRWEDAASIPGVYSTADGGYQFPTRDLWDVQQDLLGDYVDDGDLMSDVLEAFSPQLVAESWGDDDEILGDPWERFSNFVMHRTRYMFWADSESLNNSEERWYGGSPVTALDDLARRLHAHGLVRSIAPEVNVWRAQGHRGPDIEGGATSTRLGTVPKDKAFSPNRMSAPGVPMFYGSLERDTAIAEATRHGDPHHDHATVASFQATRELVVLDLTNVVVPAEPSVFMDTSDPSAQAYYDASFLDDFVSTVRKPASEDPGRRGIDYVPTQVFTEFVLHAMGQMAEPPQRIDGILYPSAEVPDGVNMVLDVTNRCCVEAASAFALAGNRLELVLDADSIVVARRDWIVNEL